MSEEGGGGAQGDCAGEQGKGGRETHVSSVYALDSTEPDSWRDPWQVGGWGAGQVGRVRVAGRGFSPARGTVFVGAGL